jgi:hypothetical protein
MAATGTRDHVSVFRCNPRMTAVTELDDVGERQLPK